jgi:hypothetical protein
MPRRTKGEGSVSTHKRKDGRWEARIDLGWQGGKRRYKSFYGVTKAEASDKLANARQAADAMEGIFR